MDKREYLQLPMTTGNFDKGEKETDFEMKKKINEILDNLDLSKNEQDQNIRKVLKQNENNMNFRSEK